MTKGFTLIEILIYLAIVGFILALVLGFSWNIMEGEGVSAAWRETQQNGRQSLQQINQLIRQASSINNINADSLELEMPSDQLNPTIIELEEQRIKITQGLNDSFYLTNNDIIVDNLTFTDLSYAETPGTIKTELTLKFNNPSGQAQYDTPLQFQSTTCLSYGNFEPIEPLTITLWPDADDDILLATGGTANGACTGINCQYVCYNDPNGESYVVYGPIVSTIGQDYDIYTLTDTIINSGEISQVRILFKGAYAGSVVGQGRTIIELPDLGQDYGNWQDLPEAGSGTGQEEEFMTGYTEKPNNQPWTWSDINNLKVGVQLGPWGWTWPRATEVRVEVEYVPY